MLKGESGKGTLTQQHPAKEKKTAQRRKEKEKGEESRTNIRPTDHLEECVWDLGTSSRGPDHGSVHG